MRKIDNHNPNTGPPKPRKPTQHTPLPPALEQLETLARRSVQPHNLPQLVLDTTDSVRWLRGRMESGPEQPENGQQSCPPLKLSYMQAADRETACIAYWAHHFGIRPNTFDGLWVNRGVISGVIGDSFGGLWDLCRQLADKLAYITYDAVANDPVWGVWSVREQHFRNWPELAGYFATKNAPDEKPVDGLRLF